MIAVYDAKQLEFRVVAHNANDKIAIEEIGNGLDFHADNVKKFKLPSRLVAKKFLFRNIYCPLWLIDRTAYAYSVDNEFKAVGGVRFWKEVINRFYEKYTGIYEYHKKLKQEAVTTGRIVSNTGRIYDFEPRMRRGELVWPDSDIVNYPVSGFSADLMEIIRVSCHRRLQEQREKKEVLFVNTVHDNIVLDINGDIRKAVEISKIVKSSFQDCGKNYERIYGDKLLVPMDADAKVGINYKWVHEIKL